MKNTQPTKYIVAVFIWLLPLHIAFAQTTITQKDGTVLEIGEGVVIKYSIAEDWVEYIDTETEEKTSIPAIEIEYVALESGERYYSKYVNYIGLRQLHEQKWALVQKILGGAIHFYEYDGPRFEYALEKQDEIYPLQNLPSHFEPVNVYAFPQVKLMLFNDCFREDLDRDYVVDVKLKRNALVALVNRYNSCMDEHYVANEEAVKRVQRADLRVNFGTRISTMNLNILAINGVTGTRIYAEDVTNYSPVLELQLSNNIRGSKHFYFYSEVSASRQEIDVNSASYPGKVSSYIVSMSVGPSIKRDISKSLSTQINVGPNLSYLLDRRIIIFENNSEVNLGTVYERNYNFGAQVSANLDYALSEKHKLNFKATFFLTDMEGVYSSTLLFDIPESDVQTNQFMFTLGLNFYRSSSRY